MQASSKKCPSRQNELNDERWLSFPTCTILYVANVGNVGNVLTTETIGYVDASVNVVYVAITQ
jgi:hypothetical protein